MLTINYSEEVVGLSQSDNPSFGRLTHIWEKAEFETLAGVNLSPYHKVIYEPFQNLYAVVMTATPTVIDRYPSPSDHPAIAWIHNHVDQLIDAAEQFKAAELNWVAVGDGYIPAEQAMGLAELRDYKIRQVRSQAFTYAGVILQASQLNTLANLGIAPQITARLNQIRAWMNDHESAINLINTTAELLDYEIDSLDNQQDSDINFVMGLL